MSPALNMLEQNLQGLIVLRVEVLSRHGEIIKVYLFICDHLKDGRLECQNEVVPKLCYLVYLLPAIPKVVFRCLSGNRDDCVSRLGQERFPLGLKVIDFLKQQHICV